jgi:hypothetical protein
MVWPKQSCKLAHARVCACGRAHTHTHTHTHTYTHTHTCAGSTSASLARASTIPRARRPWWWAQAAPWSLRRTAPWASAQTRWGHGHGLDLKPVLAAPLRSPRRRDLPACDRCCRRFCPLGLCCPTPVKSAAAALPAIPYADSPLIFKTWEPRQAVAALHTGWHAAIYVADFSGVFSRVEALGLIDNNHPYRCALHGPHGVARAARRRAGQAHRWPTAGIRDRSRPSPLRQRGGRPCAAAGVGRARFCSGAAARRCFSVHARSA